MDSATIQTRLEKLIEEYNAQIVEWAKAKSEHDRASDLKKTRLAVFTGRSNAKSFNEREREALASKDYHTFLNDVFAKDCLYWSLQARKDGIMAEIDVLRSLLSHEKAMIGLTQ